MFSVVLVNSWPVSETHFHMLVSGCFADSYDVGLYAIVIIQTAYHNPVDGSQNTPFYSYYDLSHIGTFIAHMGNGDPYELPMYGFYTVSTWLHHVKDVICSLTHYSDPWIDTMMHPLFCGCQYLISAGKALPAYVGLFRTHGREDNSNFSNVGSRDIATSYSLHRDPPHIHLYLGGMHITDYNTHVYLYGFHIAFSPSADSHGSLTNQCICN